MLNLPQHEMSCYLASSSPLKMQALQIAFPSAAIIDLGIDFGSLTSTLQPVGFNQALECCRQRLELLKFKSNDSCSGLAFAIESFITREDTETGPQWVDKTVVVCFPMSGADPGTYMIGPPCGVVIPQAFQPPADTMHVDRSIGSLIHEAHPDVAADDWYEFAGHEVNRVHDIARTLRRCGEQRCAEEINSGLRRFLDENPMTVHQNYPTPGVQFADFFSVANKRKFGKTFCDTLKSAIDKNWILPGRLCLVGLELRGTVLASMASAALDIPLVAARKPGKLPPPVESISYTKEYGTDAIEMKKDHVAEFSSAIVIDDVIATGGSMRAACELCERLGLEVVLVVALADIEPLRKQWQNLLWKYNVCVLGNTPVVNKF